jgi:alpha-L-rhamnosidase
MKALLASMLFISCVVSVPMVASTTEKHVAMNLQVEHSVAPLTIDTVAPRFSWQLTHPQRAQGQTSYRIVVMSAEKVMWDTGVVASNQTVALYAGSDLTSDTDYLWTIKWADVTGSMSTEASSTFSTALLKSEVDWLGAEWISANGAENLFRAVLPPFNGLPRRAHLYIAGVGYYKSTINGRPTDEHLLGPQSTLQVRCLYDVWDVTSLLQSGCNSVGVAVGNGWGNNTHSRTQSQWKPQFIALLSVTHADGATSYYRSSIANSSAPHLSSPLSGGAAAAAAAAAAPLPQPLQFTSAEGPVTYDDVFDGESFDGRVAKRLQGWDTCSPPKTSTWQTAITPARSPADHNATMSAHTLQTVIIRDYDVRAGGQQQPRPGVWVFDFGQNMAGIATLRVRNCAAGTVIRLQFGEILWDANGTLHNQFPPGMALMLANYTCAGSAAVEEYRTQFSSFGFQYVQMEGYPGVPLDDALTAHFIGPDFAPAAEFSSSSAVLNAIQRSIVATITANWANDVPSDCPHRERKGYLGDGQSAVEAVASNFDAARGYIKWLRGFGDNQQFINDTLGHQYDPALPTKGFGHGRVGGVAPFGDGQQTDIAWEIAFFVVPAFIAEWYADERVIHDMYASARWSVEHLIDIANTNDGWFDYDKYGDFGNGNIPADKFVLDKTQYFYITALQHMAQFAEQVGNAADAQRYANLTQTATSKYMHRLYANSSDGCFGNCTYVNQIFGMSLEQQAAGSPEEAASWAKILQSFADGPNRGDRWCGGIISTKLIYPLFHKFGAAALALRTLLHTDKAPSLGYETVEVSSTTLHEAWSMTGAYKGTWVGSFNHAMFASPGRWFYTMFAGIDRQDPQRRGQTPSWHRLRLEPPRDPALWANLTSCSGALRTTAGQVAVSWKISRGGDGSFVHGIYEMTAQVPTNSLATIVVPTLRAANETTVLEGAVAVWTEGRFHADVAGISSAVAGSDGRSVAFEAGSGTYRFVVGS